MRCVRAVFLVVLAMAGAVPAVRAETRVALVVGNSTYAHTGTLANPRNDAGDMAAALKAAGFDVISALDADKRAFDRALRSFADRMAKADVALFYFAGHGLQVGAQNYLVPIDAKLERERDLEFEAVKLEFVLRQMEIDREGKTSIVMLDACRDNPLSRNLARSMGTRSTAIGQGLAAAATGLGTFIAYATQPGNVALDGEGRNSPFTAALVRHMSVEGRNLPATMIEVRKEVVAATRGRQVPWDHSALTGDFFFTRGQAAPVAAAPAAGGSDVAALQERLKKLEDEARQREVATAAPKGPLFVFRANNRIEGEQIPAPPSTANCESRCRSETACMGYNLSRDGICELFRTVARRVEDAKWRSGVRADVVASPAASAPAVPPIEPKATKAPSRLTRDDNVRIDGIVLSESRQTSPDACQRICEATPRCIAYRHGKRAPVMGQCLLFETIERRQEDLAWRSGAISAATSAPDASTARPVLLPPELIASGIQGEVERGFVVYRGALLSGDIIKTARADSRQSCGVVCRNTPGCVGASYHSRRDFTENCTVLRSLGAAVTGDRDTTALVRSD